MQMSTPTVTSTASVAKNGLQHHAQDESTRSLGFDSAILEAELLHNRCHLLFAPLPAHKESPMPWIAWAAEPEAWIALATLTLLEIVLGVDNIIFISILVGRLPEEQRDRARRIGLALAMISRIVLLLSITWVMRLTTPLFAIFGTEISGRDLILIVGGVSHWQEHPRNSQQSRRAYGRSSSWSKRELSRYSRSDYRDRHRLLARFGDYGCGAC